MARALFEKVDDESDRIRLPLALYGGATLGPRQQATITFGGASPGDLMSDLRLRTMVEDQIVDLALGLPGVTLILAEYLGMTMPIWCLVRTPRRVLFPSDPNGQPGDFDLIVGEARGTFASLERLALLECKLGKVRSGEDLPKYASGRGTTQMAGACELGFDQLVLLHFLVRDPATRTASQAAWADASDAANFSRTMNRMNGALATHAEGQPYGAMMIGWGHVHGVDPALSGAFSPVPLWDAPRSPRDRARASRMELENNLRRLLPERRPVQPFFRFCEACGTADVFGADLASIKTCDRHR